MQKIERTIDLCTDCIYCKEFQETGGNTDYVIICTQNQEDYTSEFLIERSLNKILCNQDIKIPDNCPLEDYRK